MSQHYKRDILFRLLLVAGSLLLFGLLVVWQIVHIQFAEGEQWRELSKKLTYTYKEIDAVRGNIYAADGSLLATSVPRYDVRFDTRVVHKDTFQRYHQQLATLLAVHVGARSYPEYISMLKKAQRRGDAYLLLRRKATYLDIKQMREWPIFRLGRYKGGFIVEEETIRTLPFGSLASRTIGFYHPEIGGVGLERACNSVLAGVKGKRLVQKISGGYRPLNDENAIDPVQGRDVYTSINPQIQDITHDALHKALKLHGADHGCAVLMEVKTGRIVAISNLSRTSEGEYKERFNYSFGAAIEPGSTFKLLSALALLEDGHYSPDDSINIYKGRFTYFGQLMLDSETGHHDKLSFQQAFELSSNVGISRMVYNAYGAKPEKFLSHIKRLGLADPLGISLPGEAPPVVKQPSKAGWYGTTLPWMSIGYELNLTPLHILSLYNAVANNGKMMKPTLITGYGKTAVMEEELEPEVLNSSIGNEKTIAALKRMLEGVVERGTARNLKNLGFPVAGKTGTALIADRNKGYEAKVYNASFAGYFPADDPAFSCIVVVSRPASGSYYGSSVAAPVFGEIARKVVAKQMQVPFKPGLEARNQGSWLVKQQAVLPLLEELNTQIEVPSDNASYWSVLSVDSNSAILKPIDISGMTMPALQGMGLADALYLLENRGLKVKYRGLGKVAEQFPAAGTPLKNGQMIYIRLGDS